MGFHVESGSEVKTPKFWFNHCGALAWGGLLVSEIGEQGAREMRRFVDREAYSQGFNMGITQAWNPFHERLLFGEPYKLWNVLFEKGALDAANGTEFNFPEGDYTDDEFMLLPAVVAALEEMAEGFEAAYKRIGIDCKSGLRGTSEALIGWMILLPRG